jgi:hypothetical protein
VLYFVQCLYISATFLQAGCCLPRGMTWFKSGHIFICLIGTNSGTSSSAVFGLCFGATTYNDRTLVINFYGCLSHSFCENEISHRQVSQHENMCLETEMFVFLITLIGQSSICTAVGGF